MITSPQNSKVKALVRLRKDGNARRAEGRFFVEGRAVVAAALETGAPVVEILYSPNLLGREHPLLARAARAGLEVIALSKDCFRKIADTKSPQGIAVVVEIAPPRAEVLEEPRALVVCACGLADPGNLGTIIRSADAAGATAVVTLPPSVDPYNAKVVRATAASLFNVPVLPLETGDFLARAAAAGLRIVAAVPEGGALHTGADWSRPVCIVVGSEAHGVAPEVLAAAACRVSIPIRGGAESLNAAVAASILLYEAVR